MFIINYIMETWFNNTSLFIESIAYTVDKDWFFIAETLNLWNDVWVNVKNITSFGKNKYKTFLKFNWYDVKDITDKELKENAINLIIYVLNKATGIVRKNRFEMVDNLKELINYFDNQSKKKRDSYSEEFQEAIKRLKWSLNNTNFKEAITNILIWSLDSSKLSL